MNAYWLGREFSVTIIGTVCAESEDVKWPLGLFNGLLDAIETEDTKHPITSMFCGDEPSMQDKPENIRRDSVRGAVQKAFDPYDSDHGVHSFAGAPVDDHYGVPILQPTGELFERFHSLRVPVSDDGRFAGHAKLIYAAKSEVLAASNDELF